MKFLISVLLAGVSTVAFAQSSSVGALESVKGIVSVNSKGTVSTVTGRAELYNGSIIFNSVDGSGLVRLSNGCTFSLAPNQVLTIDTTLSCPDQIASIKSTALPNVAINPAPNITVPVFLGLGAIAGGAAIYNNQKKKASAS